MPKPERRERDGKVRWLARYRDPDGRQRSRTFDRQIDAQRFLDETVVSVRRGTYLDPDKGRETFASFAAAWMTAQDFDPSTRAAVEQRLTKHVIPALGSKHLVEITPLTIQGWMKDVEVAPSYRRVIHANVSAILQAAVDEGDRIARNPARVKKSKPGPVQHKKVVPWTARQVGAARKALPEQYRILVTLGAGLGLRQGELFGLSPDDVDFTTGTVHVRRQVKILPGNRLVFAKPKGPHGGKERDVPLPTSVRRELAAHLLKHPAREVTLPWREPAGAPTTVRLVVTSRESRPLNRNHFNGYHWAKAAAAAQLTDGQDVGMHQLRHFYASVLLDAGESIRTVAEHLGHSDPGFTLRVYTHLMPSAEDRTKKAVDAALASCVPDVYPEAGSSA